MGVLFEVFGDAAEILDLVEKAFDLVALLIERLGEAMPFPAVGFVGYARRRALRLDALAQPIGVIGFVAEKNIAVAQTGPQGVGAEKVVGLARGEQDFRSAVRARWWARGSWWSILLWSGPHNELRRFFTLAAF